MLKTTLFEIGDFIIAVDWHSKVSYSFELADKYWEIIRNGKNNNSAEEIQILTEVQNTSCATNWQPKYVRIISTKTKRLNVYDPELKLAVDKIFQIQKHIEEEKQKDLWINMETYLNSLCE